MPRRAQLAAPVLKSASPQPDSNPDNLSILRTQWRWAAFSQFFFTFSPLFAMNDVSIADIEQDLVYDNRLFIPRVMQRLLYTLTYDRKISTTNWQTALRKQYNKRDPHANPIGPEPPSADVGQVDEEDEKEIDGDDSRMEGPADGGSSQNNDEVHDGQRDKSSSRAMSASAEPIPSELVSQQDPYSTRQSSAAVMGGVSSLMNDVENGVEQQKSMDWFDLSMLEKLESMHALTEWQFHNPTRLRMIMKSDDELALWRIEPIGYDAKRNAYWFIGKDRLWIQRVPPKAPRVKPLKRKRPAPSDRTQAPKAAAKGAKRLKLSVAETPSAKRAAVATSSPSSGRHSRAAKDQAKMKLDAQARELAELNRQATFANAKPKTGRQSTLRSQVSTISTPRSGTRLSARLRGNKDEEWQPIPEGWLSDSGPSKGAGKRRAPPKTGLESDEESTSDLTELSDDESEVVLQPTKGVAKGKATAKEEEDEDEEPVPEQQFPVVPDDFVEWELMCSTLYEWDHIAELFEKATHYSEKALYKILVNEIVPGVTEEMREVERKRQMEEALSHRKRSSRLAVRENEKEEARLAAQRKQEEEEKMSRARRLEVRQQKEEAERIKREHAREQRRQEREAREESRKAQVAAEEAKAKAKELAKEDAKKPKAAPPARETHKPREIKANGKQSSSSGSHTPAGEDWELACEICHRQGINLDDDSPVVSCGVCSRWQHIQCHDRADRTAGRPRRNWNTEDFVCGRCRATQRMQYNSHHLPAGKALPPMNVPQVQPYGSYQSIAPLNPHASYPQDHRSSSHYTSGYKEPTQQSYYVRPTNGHQFSNAQPQYPQAPSNHSTISFNHYQPAEQGFSSSSYQSNQYPYGQATNTVQHYRQAAIPPYKTQPSVPAWNANGPAQGTGYAMPLNGSVGIGSSSSYRHPTSDTRDRDNNPPIPTYPLETSQTSQTSYSRYPAGSHYPPTQFKHHPASYQPPLGR